MKFDIVISGMAVDPVDGVYNATIWVKNGRIEKISGEEPESKKIIQLTSSQLIFPGFIDPHVHLREPGWEHKEDFLTGSKAALHGGVTTVGDMPNLPEPIVNKERLKRKKKLAKKSLIDILHFGGVGNDLSSIRALAPVVPAYKIYTAESTGELTLKNWQQIEEATRIISKLKKPITFHCEDQLVNDKAREELKNKSYPWKHCDERPAESEISAIEKALSMSKNYNTKANIAHLSTKEGLDLVKEAGAVNYEITPHHLFFTKHNMKNSLLKVNPPLREEKDARALLREIRNGECMLATDHAPHTLQEKKANAPSGIPGLDTYGNFALWLMLEKKIKTKTIARITSYNAAKYLGLNDMARIKEDSAADFVILDTNGRTEITNENLHTKCKWSAFEGRTFPGKIICTIKAGKPYFQ